MILLLRYQYGFFPNCRRAFILMAGVLALFVFFAHQLHARKKAGSVNANLIQNLEQIAHGISAVAVQQRSLVNEYGESAGDYLAHTVNFDSRLADAEILYALQDYQTSSLVLFELVGDGRNESELFYYRAIYFLADSQFLMGNIYSAREYFKILVEDHEGEPVKSTGRWRSEAVRRLIEIADATADWDGIDRYITTSTSGERLPFGTLYIYGKSLLRRKAYKAAHDVLESIPKKDSLYAKSQYLNGVIFVEENSLQAAVKTFSALTHVDARYNDARAISDLSTLNVGRLLLEQGLLEEGAAAYSAVPSDSAYLAESKYELAWLYIKVAGVATSDQQRLVAYSKALLAIEVLLLGMNESVMIPEAHILLGNILLKMERYDDAVDAFKEVSNIYTPVYTRLKELVKKHADPKEYYNEILARQADGGDMLPPIAMRYANEQDRLQNALDVVGSLSDSEEWLQQSYQILGELQAVVDSSDAGQFFPVIQRVQGQRKELRNMLNNLSERLLQVQRKLVSPMMDDSQRDALRQVLATRKSLYPAYAKLPQDRADFEQELDSARQMLNEPELATFRMKWRLEEIKQTAAALRTWLTENTTHLTAGERVAVEERLQLVDNEVAEFIRLQHLLETDISVEQKMVVLDSGPNEVLRREYLETLEAEKKLLRVAAGKLQGQQVLVLDSVQQNFSIISTITTELNTLGLYLAKLVARHTDDARLQLRDETAKLTAFERAIEASREAAKTVVGELAMASLFDLKSTFRSFLLRGDVGGIDVAWAVKGQQTEEIGSKVESQRNELSALDLEFQEILSED